VYRDEGSNCTFRLYFLYFIKFLIFSNEFASRNQEAVK
jgi:hypothetical protein